MCNAIQKIDREEVYQKDAYFLLDKLNVTQLPIDLDYILSCLDIKKEYMDIFDDKNSNYSGCISINDGHAIIKINPLDPNTRQRFTIAHEICHYLWDFPEDLTNLSDSEKVIKDEKFYRSNQSNPIEVRANKFASQLLMPKNMIIFQAKRLLGIQTQIDTYQFIVKMANRFDVSLKAMEIRLEQLNILKS